jgi:ribosomal protein S18 acetylase RimI-like enzyme
MKITRAIIDDAEEILNVQKAAFLSEAEHYNDHSIAPLTENLDELKEKFGTHVILKAVLDGKIVGSVRAYEKEGTCYIGRLSVLPQMQNKGVGTKLMKEIEACFNPVRYDLFTASRTTKNVELYKKLGYSEYKREFRGCGNIEAVYMEKSTQEQMKGKCL